MKLFQLFQEGLFSGELKFLFFVLTIITVVNVVLSIDLSIKLARIKIETNKIELRNEALQVTNKNLKDTIKRLNSAIKNNEERIDFLSVQMEQVHDWLGRLTISDFLTPNGRDTTDIMEELTERVEYAKEEKRLNDRQNQ